jgi:uncharacterized protein YkwD
MSSASTEPRRVTTRTLALGVSALLAAGMLTWSPAATTGWNQGAAEGTLWQLLNGARVNNGMAPLQQHGTLVSLARWRSGDMLKRDYFSHTIPGCGCLVYAYYDSNGLNYVWGGENIGWNSGRSDAESPVRVHEQFMGSSGHRANVLNRAFTHGGVGAAAADNQMFQGHVQNTRMYTELFLQAPSAPAPAPQPAPSQPAPAPPPSGGGGAGPAPAPSAAAAPASTPKPKPKPKPKVVRVERPQRPSSSAGIDGHTTRVSRPQSVADTATRLQLEDRAAERFARQVIAARVVSAATAMTLTAAATPASLEVAAPAAPEPGVLESIVGAVIGFLFG